ncbi:MAG TPA: J domain-containing protein, partial [Burkholderiales bacterium]|nr:J domain-containing protein [Burkholderiales bacterium]
MEESTDLYAILGVLPNAEDVVIRAAYRILAQRYQPDRYKGNAAEGADRLRRIEEAYAILGDPARRRQYDQQAGADAGTEYWDKGHAENLLDAPGWRSDWDLACHFYPALRDAEAQFRSMSPALAFTFCATLMETKRFPEGEAIAGQMEQAYLGKSFGDDPDILGFAKRLIVSGNNEAVRTLKRALKVLGSSTPASVIIDTLTRDFLQAPAEGAREPESEPEPDPAAADTAAGEPGAEETPPAAAEQEEAAVEETVSAVAHVEEPVIPEPATHESAAPAMIEAQSAAAPGEEAVAAEPTAEEPPAVAPAPAAPTAGEALASEQNVAKTPKPEPAEPVVATAPPPPPPKPAAPAPAKPAAKAPPAAKHEFKDPKKRASAQGVLRAC